jgi:hypothetical protein
VVGLREPEASRGSAVGRRTPLNADPLGGTHQVMSNLASALHENSPRPWWMTALSLFCLGSVVFLIPRDLLFSETRDVEVWLGFEIRGIAALVTAPIHWAIFLLGAWGFWHRRPWILPCAAGYVFYIALSHLIWSEVSPNGRGWPVGLAQAVVISMPGMFLFRACRLTWR